MEAGAMAMQLGRVDLTEQAFTAAAAAADRLGRAAAAGEAMARLGEMRLALSLPEPASVAFDLAEKLLSKGNHDDSVARLGLLRAEVSVLEGDIDGAVSLLRKAASRLASLDDVAHQALACSRLGRLLYERGALEAATVALDDAISRADECGDPRASGAARLSRAFVHGERGELDPAFKLLQEAASSFQEIGIPMNILEVAAADLQRRNGKPEEAAERLNAVVTAFRESGAVVQWADALHALARCDLAQGKHTEAAQALLEIRGVRIRARDRFGLIRAMEDLSQCYEGQGDFVGAYRCAAEASNFISRLSLEGHRGRLHARLKRLAGKLDSEASVDLQGLEREAEEEVDGMEARWNAPPQPKEPSSQVH
jgi:tetratricopeptide (TPR) repeat protein